MGRVIINMRVLAIAAILILASSSEARRRPGNGGRPQKQRQPKEDAGTIIRCMAENFGQDDKIQECRDCFKALGKDVMSETNLPKAKECAAQYWPSLSEACADQISELSPNNGEAMMEVVECFDETLESQNYERCLGESTATETAEKLTDGALCVLESWKFGMEYVKNATKGQGGRGPRGRPGSRRPRARGGRGKGGKKGMMMKMLSKAHCQNANPEDETKEGECNKCFKDAVKNNMKKGAAPDKAAMMTDMTACADQFLASKYSTCNTMMSSGQSEKDEVMECGQEKVKEFVMENAGPKALKMIGNMLGDK